MQDILTELKLELEDRGIERFATFRLNGVNIQTNCPFHKGGQERKPSFGVHKNTGECHCFACGWSGTLDMMIGELFHRDTTYGHKWLLQHFGSQEIENRERLVELPLKRVKQTQGTKREIEDLDKYRWVHPYMYERGLTDELIEFFDIGYDRQTDCITFPVYNAENQLEFVARRSVKGKMYKYPPNVQKPVYALNQVSTKEVYVVESFFNCFTLWKYGKQAVALLGTGKDEQYNILRKSNIRTFILALDPDDAGRAGTIRFRRALGKDKIIKEVQYEKEGVDVNDLDETFFNLPIVL